MTEHIRTDKQFLQHVAACYLRLEHSPESIDVRGAYLSFAGEIRGQYIRLTRYLGVTVEPVAEDPYRTSAELFADIRNRNAFKVYRTVELPVGHPGLWDIGIDGLNLNTAFRAVHDYYGHFVPGNSFSMTGEYRAFLAHAASFRRPDSVRVVATETLGQNAVFNHGPFAALPAAERPYAEQKAALLDSDTIARALAGEGLPK